MIMEMNMETKLAKKQAKKLVKLTHLAKLAIIKKSSKKKL